MNNEYVNNEVNNIMSSSRHCIAESFKEDLKNIKACKNIIELGVLMEEYWNKYHPDQCIPTMVSFSGKATRLFIYLQDDQTVEKDINMMLDHFQPLIESLFNSPYKRSIYVDVVELAYKTKDYRYFDIIINYHEGACHRVQVDTHTDVIETPVYEIKCD